MRLATWNVNSLRARMVRVEEWLLDVQPDVVCMQETKMAQDAFPTETFAAMGYESVHHGQGQWNGVAILSRVGLENPVRNFADGQEPDPEARLVTATCAGIRVSSVYVPNGRELDHDHYKYKLAWMKRLIDHLDADTSPTDGVVVTGDYNIAPEDQDVYNPADFVGATHVSEAERQVLRDLEAWGMSDVFRHHHRDDKLYSWWDYRAGGFNQNKGMRIDLILATQSVLEKTRWTIVDRQARKGEKPSDHAPVLVDIDV
ncbi:MAG: exodeoxyribonuclease III [Ilumatobacteraceae bacterium]|nr:exodeoxyribonuclease III [Ilumatobacteraceae bacterium]